MSVWHKPLRYLIGADSIKPNPDAVVEGSYDAPPAGAGPQIAYCNLFHENRQTEGRKYEPYLPDTDTSSHYGEGRIRPGGAGWKKNIERQLKLRQSQGHTCVEFDNPDAYDGKWFEHVLAVVDQAQQHGLLSIAKNPLLLEWRNAITYVRHPAIIGAIVEKDDDVSATKAVHAMHGLRVASAKPDLPVWFVSFGKGKAWANAVAAAAKTFQNMGVTYSPDGEYASCIDIHGFK